MNNIDYLIEAFQLKEDPLYPKMKKVARHLEADRRYTTEEIFSILAKKYRHTMGHAKWVDTVNKLFDLLIYYELMKQEEGYFYKTS